MRFATVLLVLGVWGLHPGFHREQLGEQTQGDVAGSGGTITRESAVPEGAVAEEKQGKTRLNGPGEAQGLWPSPKRCSGCTHAEQTAFSG